MKCLVNKRVFYFFACWHILLMLGNVPVRAEENIASESVYDRPDPQLVHQELQEIVSQNRYKPKKSFFQHLREFFFGVDRKAPEISSAVGWFFFWVLMIWCFVTLFAILGHFIWSIVVMSRKETVLARNTGPSEAEMHDKTEKELRALIQELINVGDYYHAVQCLMLATLKKLDSKGVLRFHASKTNGDYLHDFPREYKEYPDFKTCIGIFERCIYGRQMPSQAAYNQMIPLIDTFEAIE